MRPSDRSLLTLISAIEVDRGSMSFINFVRKEINCKVVYCGPGMCGKTTNIRYIYDHTDPEARGRLIESDSEAERGLSFDFLTFYAGEIRGFKTRFHLYSVPGNVFRTDSRKAVLKNVDGVVFVADSDPDRMDANEASLAALNDDLREYGYEPTAVPLVLQYNKRDLSDALSTEKLRAQLNPNSVPDFEAKAIEGLGVFDTLKTITKMVLMELKRGQ